MENKFDLILKTTPDYKEVPKFNPTGEFEGIKAITYDAAPIGNMKTKAFAYIGYPDDVSKKVPAIVLVHGGGGVAYLPWIKKWNERGYAAIAMSNTGDFPIEINAGHREYPEQKEMWNHGLYGEFIEEGYVDAPDNDSMKNSEKPIEEQWMYHAVSQVILAHNILRADDKIDSNKIGITGISWGGVITSLAIGYDTRFAFAIPVYGSGYLCENMGFCNYVRYGKNPQLWLAEKRFEKVSMPVLWQCWNSDDAFSINANSKSYLDTIKNNNDTRLSIVHEMYHGHIAGWDRPEPFAFANSVCKGADRFPTFVCDNIPAISNPDNAEVVFVKLYYLTEPLFYNTDENGSPHMEQEWNIIDCEYENDEVKYEIPDEAREYYFEIEFKINGGNYITTSPYIQR